MGFDLREFLNANNKQKAQKPAPARTAAPKQNKNPFSGITNFASKAYDQVNPLDNGLSAKTRTIAPQNQNKGAFQQAGHIVQPVANVAGGVWSPFYNLGAGLSSAAQYGINSARGRTADARVASDDFGRRVSGVVDPFKNLFDTGTDAGKAAIANATHNQKAADNANNALNQHASNAFLIGAPAKLAINYGTSLGVKNVANNPNLTDEEKNAAIQGDISNQYQDAGLTGINDKAATRKIIGQSIETGINILLARNAAEAPKTPGATIGARLRPGVVTGAKLGFANSIPQILQQDKITPGSALATVGSSTIQGAALPLVTGLLGEGIKASPKALNTLDNVKRTAANLPEKPLKVLDDNEIGTLAEYSDHLHGVKSDMNTSELHALELEARAAAKRTGLDITSGNTLERAKRISDELDRQIAYQKSAPNEADVLEGGYVKNPLAKEGVKEKPGVAELTPKELAYNQAKAKLQENHTQVPTIPKTVEDTLNNTKLANPALNRVKGVGEELRGLFSPTHGKEAKAITNDLRATLGNTSLKQNLENIAAKDDVATFKKMTTGDHLNFIQRIDSGVAQPTPELQALADKFHVSQEQDYQLAQSIKPGVNHIDNYFPRAGFWDNSSKQVDSFLSQWAKPTLGGKPSALEQRGIPTIYDGIKFGLQPKESNPAIIALTSRNQLIKAAEAEKFKAEQGAKGINPATTQQYIDRSLGRGLKDSSAFQVAKATSNALNSTQLGLSGFHVTGTALNAVTSQFANGLQDVLHGHPIKGIVDAVKAPFAPAEYIFKGSKIIKDFKAGNTTADIQNIAEGGGRIGGQVDYKATGLAKSLEQLKSGSVTEGIKGVASAPFRAFNTAAKPIMEYWVPRIKAGAEKELIDRKLGELPKDASPETIRAAKAAAIDSIDNRFGQLTQDNLMWNKTLKDGMGLIMRSPGWNIGTIREIGGGLTDLATKTARGKGLSERTAYTASLAATTMMLGTAMSYMFTGKPPQDAKDYFYPKTGKTDKNGNEERVSLPTYAKDVFAFAHNPAQTVKNKAAPGLGIAQNLASNKDYYGNLIRNPQDSAGTQAKQTGQFIAKSTLPFSVTAGNQRAEKTPSTATQSFFGVAPAPGYITKSNFSQKVQAALSQATGSKPLTPEQQKLVTDKTEAKNQLKAGSTDALQNLVRSGQITAKQGDNLFLTSQKPSLANQYAYLLKVDPKSANDLLKTAGPDDLKQLQNVPGMSDALAKYATKNNTTSNAASAPSSPSSTTNTTSLPSGKVTATVGGSQKTFANQAAADKAIALDKFKSSPAKTMTSGNTYFYKAKDGSVKSKSTAQQAYDSQASGRQLALDSAVRSNDLKTWTNLASQEYDALEKLKSQYDPQTEQKQIDAITIKQQNLKQKASGYSTKGYIKKSTGAKKAKKFDYAKGLSTTNKTAFSNATALRNLVKKTRITKRRLA